MVKGQEVTEAVLQGGDDEEFALFKTKYQLNQ